MNNIYVYTKENIAEIKWPNDDIKNYFLSLLQNGVSHYIKNAYAEFCLLQMDSQIIPLTICEYTPNNTYLCSIYTQYIRYSIDELRIIENKSIRKIITKLLLCLGEILNKKNLDKSVHINNWLFPTNICESLSLDQLNRMTQYLLRKYPDHALVFRGLNVMMNHQEISYLKKLKYSLLISRKIYLLDQKTGALLSTKKPNDLVKDEKILERSKYEIIASRDFSITDLEKMRSLYDLLYLDKYSYCNPQFNVYFLELLMRCPLFTMIALKNDQEIDGFIGYLVYQGVTYAPLLGYQTHFPQKTGLYRMLFSINIHAALNNKTLLHSSAGAGRFKLNRGHQAFMEYHGVYAKNLSFKRKFSWGLLKMIVNTLGFLILKYHD